MISPAPPVPRQIQSLRSSSRRLVRVLGVINARFAEVDCTPAQCHALLELAREGRLTSGELARLVEIDKSTASRTLGSLVQRGLVEHEQGAGDQRRKPVRLTEAGRERVRQIDASADTQVREALALLGDEEREVVLRGVALYEDALHRAKARRGITVRPIEPRDDPAMGAIIRRVMTEFGAVGHGFSIEDPEVDGMHAAYDGARSAFFVAERDGVVLAGGGIAPLAQCDDPGVCELRKMYALPEARGLGVGRRLLERCLASAREAGFHTCYLETLEHMHGARALYERAGFRSLTGPMGDTGHFRCDAWYALALSGA